MAGFRGCVVFWERRIVGGWHRLGSMYPSATDGLTPQDMRDNLERELRKQLKSRYVSVELTPNKSEPGLYELWIVA